MDETPLLAPEQKNTESDKDKKHQSKKSSKSKDRYLVVANVGTYKRHIRKMDPYSVVIMQPEKVGKGQSSSSNSLKTDSSLE